MFLDVIAYTCVWEHIQVVLGRTLPHIHVTWGGICRLVHGSTSPLHGEIILTGRGATLKQLGRKAARTGGAKPYPNRGRQGWARPRIYVTLGAQPLERVPAYTCHVGHRLGRASMHISALAARPRIYVSLGAQPWEATRGAVLSAPGLPRKSQNGWRPKVSRRVSSRELCVSSGCPGVTQEPFRGSRGRLPPRPRIYV